MDPAEHEIWMASEPITLPYHFPVNSALVTPCHEDLLLLNIINTGNNITALLL
jgi:hypothetical protein